MIRDLIVIGILDSKLSKQLQLDDALTPERAVTRAIQSELVGRQQETVRQTESKNVDFVKSDASRSGGNSGKKQNSSKKNGWGKKGKFTGKPRSGNSSGACSRCGRPQHGEGQNCPAQSSNCHRCSMQGHWSKMCKQKKDVKKISGQEEDSLFLGKIHTVKKTCEPWMYEVQVGDTRQPIMWEADSGADICVLPEAQFSKELGNLTPVKTNISGPDRKSLKCLGKFEAVCRFEEKSVITDIYVMKDIKKPLLGRPVLEELGILKRVKKVESTNPWVQKFPELFKEELGTMKTTP